MSNKNKVSIFLIILMILFVPDSFADKIYLKNGKVIEGDIIKQKKSSVKIMVNGIPLMYFQDEIDKIEESQKKVPVEQSVQRTIKDFESIPESKRKLILELMDKNGAKENIDLVFNNIMKDFPKERVEKFKSVLNTDEVVLRIVPVYDKYFTEKEIEVMVDFYSSSAGKKLIGRMPDMAKDTAEATVKYFKERLPEGM